MTEKIISQFAIYPFLDRKVCGSFKSQSTDVLRVRASYLEKISGQGLLIKYPPI